MRYEPEHKTRTRDRIVRNAARKLRAQGLSGSGVASVMRASGLTVGGFYKHFRSKDELLADAIAQAFEDSEKVYSSLENVPREDRWKEIVRRYLSPEHCDHPDTGCPVAALATEIARAKVGVRKRISGSDESSVLSGGWSSCQERPQRSESETSLSFSVRWSVPCRLPASLASLPTEKECWPAYEIICCAAFDFFCIVGLHT